MYREMICAWCKEMLLEMPLHAMQGDITTDSSFIKADSSFIKADENGVEASK
jgi:hypothetical protein